MNLRNIKYKLRYPRTDKLIFVSPEKSRKQKHLFDYMKVNSNESKINESPNVIQSLRLHCYQKDALPFMSNKNGSIVNIGIKGSTHNSVISPDKDITQNYSGRMWFKNKIISFWSYPHKETFIKIIDNLENKLNKKFWNDGWKIEIILNNDKPILDYNTSFYTEGEDLWSSKIIPIEDYLKSENFSEEERNYHLMNSAEKDSLRKSGKDPLKYYKSLGKEVPLSYKQAIYQESLKITSDVKSKFKQDILYPLKRESLKFDDFKKFSDSYSIYGNHGLYFHLTSNPNWKYNPEIGSRDMSSMANGSSQKGSLMVTSDLENWDYEYNFDEDENPRTSNTRDYVALIDLGDVKYHIGFGRGFGHELYIYPDEAKKVIVLDVLPIKEAREFFKNWVNIRPDSEKKLFKLWKESQLIKENKIIITNFKIFENLQVVNKSFNITQKDIDDLLEHIINLNSYKISNQEDIDYYKNFIYEMVTTPFNIDKHDNITGIENFPDTIMLYRIIELDDVEDFNKNKLGRSWCYDKNWLYNPTFHSSIGFEKDKEDWYVITALFKKEDIDIEDTLLMLIVNSGEKEIRTKEYDTKPIKYMLDYYKK